MTDTNITDAKYMSLVEGMAEPVLSVPGLELHYSMGNKWFPLPYWARFFSDLGRAVAEDTNPGERTIAGVAVPARAYAAALAATGVASARAAIAVRPSDPGEYFGQFRGSPAGNVAFLTTESREYKGVFLGCEHKSFAGEPLGIYAGIQVENGQRGGLQRWFPPGDCKRLRVSEEKADACKLPARQGGRRVTSRDTIIQENRFAEYLLGGADLYEFVTNSRLECTIVGSASTLRQEIKDTPFAVRLPLSDTFVEGALQDVLRVQKFSGAKESYRSAVFSVSSTKPPELHGCSRPAVALFDGANSFLRWRDSFPESNWIVLLDRTERQFDEAACLLNRKYMQDRTGAEPELDAPEPPPGVEVTTFREALD